MDVFCQKVKKMTLMQCKMPQTDSETKARHKIITKTCKITSTRLKMTTEMCKKDQSEKSKWETEGPL